MRGDDQQQVRGAGADSDRMDHDQPPSNEGERSSAGGDGGGQGLQPVDSESLPAFVHWCEVCGLELLLTPEIAYSLGWDYPPKMGNFGTICPRTCGACGVEGTVWYAMAVQKVTVHELTDEQYAKAMRIVGENP